MRDPADPRRERLEFACAPDVQLDQHVEELLFRAYSLYRQVDLTFEAGRDRALCLQMVYGVIAGPVQGARPRRGDAHGRRGRRVPHASSTSRPPAAGPRATSGAPPSGARSCAIWAGVTGGLTVIAAVGFLLSIGLAQLPDLQDQSGMYLASLIAGGIGALLSVLFGMTSGNLRLHTLFANAESGPGRWSPRARCGPCSARFPGRSSTCCCRAS